MKARKCSCLKQVNEELAAHNTELELVPTINFATKKFELGLLISTRKLDSKIRKPKKTVLAVYCPFCGKL